MAPSLAFNARASIWYGASMQVQIKRVVVIDAVDEMHCSAPPYGL